MSQMSHSVILQAPECLSLNHDKEPLSLSFFFHSAAAFLLTFRWCAQSQNFLFHTVHLKMRNTYIRELYKMNNCDGYHSGVLRIHTHNLAKSMSKPFKDRSRKVCTHSLSTLKGTLC